MLGKKGDNNLDNATKLAATVKMKVNDATIPINIDKLLSFDENKSAIVTLLSLSYFSYMKSTIIIPNIKEIGSTKAYHLKLYPTDAVVRMAAPPT